MMSFAHQYVCLPYHFTAMGWSLTTLGVALSVGNFLRMFSVQLVRYFGDWFAVVLLAVGSAGSIAMLVGLVWARVWLCAMRSHFGLPVVHCCGIDTQTYLQLTS